MIDKKVLQKLEEYSKGKISWRKAANALGIYSYEELVSKMSELELVLPEPKSMFPDNKKKWVNKYDAT